MAFTGNCGTGNISLGYICKLSRVHEEIDYNIYYALREARVQPSTLHLQAQNIESVILICLFGFYLYVLVLVGRTTPKLSNTLDFGSQ